MNQENKRKEIGTGRLDMKKGRRDQTPLVVMEEESMRRWRNSKKESERVIVPGWESARSLVHELVEAYNLIKLSTISTTSLDHLSVY